MWIDCGEKDANKELFDFLYSKHAEIEKKVSYPIEWNRNDEHRASNLKCVLKNYDSTKENEWPIISEFHAKASKELAESTFYAYEEEIRSRFDKKAKSSASEQSEGFLEGSWVIPCNPEIYDVVGAFNEFDTLEWSQSIKVKSGDTVYIYVSGKVGCIMYRTTVVSADHFGYTSEKDMKYYTGLVRKEKKFMVLHLDEKYPERRYPYEELRTNGLNTVQGPSRVTIELGQYLQDV